MSTTNHPISPIDAAHRASGRRPPQQRPGRRQEQGDVLPGHGRQVRQAGVAEPLHHRRRLVAVVADDEAAGQRGAIGRAGGRRRGRSRRARGSMRRRPDRRAGCRRATRRRARPRRAATRRVGCRSGSSGDALAGDAHAGRRPATRRPAGGGRGRAPTSRSARPRPRQHDTRSRPGTPAGRPSPSPSPSKGPRASGAGRPTPRRRATTAAPASTSTTRPSRGERTARGDRGRAEHERATRRVTRATATATATATVSNGPGRPPRRARRMPGRSGGHVVASWDRALNHVPTRLRRPALVPPADPQPRAVPRRHPAGRARRDRPARRCGSSRARSAATSASSSASPRHRCCSPSGAPFSDSSLWSIGVALSAMLWLIVGAVAARRTTRNPMAGWPRLLAHVLLARGRHLARRRRRLLVARYAVGEALVG